MKQYDIWLANLNPSKGTEPCKIRPVVIVQTNLLNQVDHPSTMVCPLTTQLTPKENILRVRVNEGNYGLEKHSEILIDQIRALDNRRFLEKIGELGQQEIVDIRSKIKAVLDF
ncbi:type II toxin-antitoxin system PemK/MazF family toxin [Algoriphagus sp. AGSA1]|uniref:type II toxin-antitoxin system PemK/MazF family toxin n=1 Tax=Algoriphagus sp. AGSA1 TaxID=2907213 RepID=UPI001F1A913D|nr:type II toxin-antitoxin system PemK/MazF family toxin [Algoriphagus sp. AGSA1]MCE7054349.1 type II toxin-antitoxin system PemK/MazF family toxin [Algoriphagus sp. AGSA1]